MHRNESGLLSAAKGRFVEIRDHNPQAATIVSIVAHADDTPIAAFPWIERSHEKAENFYSLVVTDGAGAPRAGEYREMTLDEYVALRENEEIVAARRASLSGVFLLRRPSNEILDKTSRQPTVELLASILETFPPTTVLTHSPFDRHTTHLAVLCCVRDALVRHKMRPAEFIGTEVWGDIPSNVRLGTRVEHLDLLKHVLGAYRSQNMARNYAEGTAARFIAHNTFSNAYAVAPGGGVAHYVDLGLLLNGISVCDFVMSALNRAAQDASAVVAAIEGETQ